jgi:hypothetical protein
MDANQFDELVARLAEGPSRRDALKGVIGGALASIGVGAVAGDDDAEAKGKGKGRKNRGGKGRSQGVSDEKKKNKKNNRAKKCKKGKKHCGNKKKCFNLQTSEKHCGNCGTRCEADETCVAGVCTPIT